MFRNAFSYVLTAGLFFVAGILFAMNGEGRISLNETSLPYTYVDNTIDHHYLVDARSEVSVHGGGIAQLHVDIPDSSEIIDHQMQSVRFPTSTGDKPIQLEDIPSILFAIDLLMEHDERDALRGYDRPKRPNQVTCNDIRPNAIVDWIYNGENLGTYTVGSRIYKKSLVEGLDMPSLFVDLVDEEGNVWPVSLAEMSIIAFPSGKWDAENYLVRHNAQQNVLSINAD